MNKSMLKLASFGLMGLVFIYMCFINYYQPYTADEYNYSLISGTYDIHVNSLWDILKSQFNLFFVWTGRNLVHFTLQFFLWIGKGWFNVINSLIFVFLIVLISIFPKWRKFDRKEDFCFLFFVLFGCWFALPAFGETIVWEAGAINYLWATVIGLLFLLPYRYALENNWLLKDNSKSTILMVLIGLLAGWSHENQSIINAFLAALFFLYTFVLKKRRNLPKWYYGGLISLFIGVVILFIAPGNYSRRDTEKADYTVTDLIQTFIFHVKIILNEQKMALIIMLTLVVVFIYTNAVYQRKKRESSEINAIIFFIVFFIAGLIASLMMILSPAFPPRASFATQVCFIIGTAFLLNGSPFYLFIKKTFYIPLLVCGILLLNSNIFVIKQYYQLHQENQFRMKLVEQAKAEGVTDLRLPFYSNVKFNGHMFGWDLTPEIDHYYGNIMARYFGFHTVKGVFGSYLDSPFQLEVDFAHELNQNTYKIYFDTGQGYNDYQMYGELIKSSEKKLKLQMAIPKNNLQKIRVNFGANNQVRIKSIKWIINNEVKKVWGPGEIYKNINPGKGVKEIKNVGGFIDLATLDFDAYIEIKP